MRWRSSAPTGRPWPRRWPSSASSFGSFLLLAGQLHYLFFFVFFFKQKTAYEISECDWSSDVCSSEHDTAYEISECDWSSDVCSSDRSEEHTSELQSHSEISYAVFCL